MSDGDDDVDGGVYSVRTKPVPLRSDEVQRKAQQDGRTTTGAAPADPLAHLSNAAKVSPRTRAHVALQQPGRCCRRCRRPRPSAVAAPIYELRSLNFSPLG